jgi:formate/nitrite transporter FocA (FNT family)
MSEATRDAELETSEEGEESGAGATRASAKEIHANVKATAEEELERPVAALGWSALAAGFTIAFSFIGGAYAASLLGPESEERHRHFAAAVAYPLGFMFVVLARSQLFTEHTLQPLIPLFERFTRPTLGRVLRLYAIVLLGNLAGALVIALAIALTPMLNPEMHPALGEIARAAMEGGFWNVFYKGIFAGWLIALMAWLVAATHSTVAQLLFIWITTAPIAALGFRHSVAGSVEVLYLAARGETGWLEAIGGFIVPAVLGNVVGGGVIVGLLNHSQVAADKKQKQEKATEKEAEEEMVARSRVRWGLYEEAHRPRFR